MHLLNPVVFSTLGLGFFKAVLADDLELEDKNVPTACQAICAPIVQLTKSCDIDSHVRHQVRKRGPISRIYRRIPDDQPEHDDTDDENDGNVTDNDDGHLTDNDDDNDGNITDNDDDNITDNDNDDDGHLTDNDDDNDDGHLTDNDDNDDGHLTDDDNDGNITDNDGHDTDDDDNHQSNSSVNANASANIDDHSDDEDAAERDCICLNKSFDVPKIAGLCASCIAQNFPPNNDDDDDALEDINKIMAQCGFPSTTYAPEATTAVTNIVVSATRPAVGDGGAATTPTSTPIPTAGLVSGGDSVKVKGIAAAAAGALALAFAWA